MLRIFLLSMSLSFLAGICFFTIRAEEELAKKKFVSESSNIRSDATVTTVHRFSNCQNPDHKKLLLAM